MKITELPVDCDAEKMCAFFLYRSVVTVQSFCNARPHIVSRKPMMTFRREKWEAVRWIPLVHIR